MTWEGDMLDKLNFNNRTYRIHVANQELEVQLDVANNKMRINADEVYECVPMDEDTAKIILGETTDEQPDSSATATLILIRS
jgi:hypothetical protein